jgi:peptidyl-prolyl cis-trans isomerase C
MKIAFFPAAVTAAATFMLLTSVQGMAAQATPTASPAPKHAASTGATTSENAVAVVNGTPISRAMFDYYVKNATNKDPSEVTPEVRAQLLDTLVRGELLVQQGLKNGIEKDGDTASQLALARLQVLLEAEATAYLKDKPPTDAQLHAEYDAQIAMMPKTEYHARHILVGSQQEAQQIIDQLKGGAKFEDLAKQKSTDSSKDQGGDLGWFAPSTMVQPFAAAITSMKKGDISQTPVQTQFGWHVIELLDTREQAPPPFESVKQRLQQLVQQKKVRNYEEDLMRTATVKKNP